MPMRDSGRLGLHARARWGPNFFLFRKSHPINVLRRKVGRPFAAKEMGSQLGRGAQLSMARHPRNRGFEPGPGGGLARSHPCIITVVHWHFLAPALGPGRNSEARFAL